MPQFYPFCTKPSPPAVPTVLPPSQWLPLGLAILHYHRSYPSFTCPVVRQAPGTVRQYGLSGPVRLVAVIAGDHCTRVGSDAEVAPSPIEPAIEDINWSSFDEEEGAITPLVVVVAAVLLLPIHASLVDEDPRSVIVALDGENSDVLDDYPAVSVIEGCKRLWSSSCNRHHSLEHASDHAEVYATGYIAGKLSLPSPE